MLGTLSRRAWTVLTLGKLAISHRLFGVEHMASELSKCPNHLVGRVLRIYGAHIAPSVYFKGNIVIDNADRDLDATGDFSNLTIADNCNIGKGVLFDLPAQIQIHEDCLVGAGVKFITHFDCGGRPLSRWYPRQTGKIVIGRGCFIGVNAVILHGVTLGECCVVAAGSVVSQSYPDNRVIAGVPARVVKAGH
jgi:acetyltransferase-like isoleucine patch superfamily enzyme